MSARQAVSHQRGRDGYTLCGLVWTPATSGTLTLCRACQAKRTAAAIISGARPLLG